LWIERPARVSAHHKDRPAGLAGADDLAVEDGVLDVEDGVLDAETLRQRRGEPMSGAGASAASIRSTISPTDHSLALTAEAMVGVIFSVLRILTKLYQTRGLAAVTELGLTSRHASI